MSLVPPYALITEGAFKRMTASAQGDMCEHAERLTRIPFRNNLNGAARWAYIKSCAADYWDSGKSKAARPKAAPPITASEVNDWLRTLPPVPLHGEAQ